MIKIALFVFCLLAQLTFAVFINLRIIQFFKQNVDVKNAFKKEDMNLKKALEISKHYQEILDRG